MNIIMSIYTFFYGFFASLLCLFLLYTLGALCFPRFIYKKTDFVLFPFLYGTALYTLICHYSVFFHFSLSNLFPLLLLLLIILGIFRLRKREWLGTFIEKRHTLQIYFLAYGIFYFLTYLFLPQPWSADYLPLLRIGNWDIFQYIGHAHFLLDMHVQNLSPLHYDYFFDVWQNWVPGIHYIFGLLSIFYGYDLMQATMPLLYLCSALVGLAIFHYSKKLFSLSSYVAIGIATIVLAGPFYRYIVGNFFLAAIINTFFQVILFTETCATDFSDPKSSPSSRIFYITLPLFLLTIMYYNQLFLVNTVSELGLVYLIGAFIFYSSDKKKLCNRMLTSTGVLTISFLIAMLLFGVYAFLQFIPMHFSHPMGWLLEKISFFTLIGSPLSMPKGLSAAIDFFPVKEILLTVFFSILMLIVLCFFFRQNKKMLAPSTWAFCCIPLAAFLLYEFYFYFSGGSYRAWKFASYYVTPFVGVVWALIFKICEVKFKKSKIIITFLVAALFLGNVFHAYFYESFNKTPAKYKRLAALNDIASPSLYLNLKTLHAIFLSAYFIPDKALYLLNSSWRSYPFNIEKDDLTRPFFLEAEGNTGTTNCKKAHGTPLKDLGCLYSSVPTLAFNERYLFNENWPIFLTLSNATFSNSQDWGGWIFGKKFSVTIYTTSEALANHPNGNIHLRIRPLIWPNIKKQHLIIQWSNKKTMSYTIKQDQTITLPYTLKDWRWQAVSSHHLRKITLDFNVPTAKLIGNGKDAHPIGIGFIELTVG